MKVLSIWPPRPRATVFRPPGVARAFPLAKPTCRFYTRARHGLFDGVSALGLEPGDEVLAPAYHHGSEIEALLRAGLVCRFYETGDALEPDEAELDHLVGNRTRALHLTHVLGFPCDASRWRRWCEDKGLLLLEDAAQAWLAEIDGQPAGSFGHLAVFCLYKTVGLPVGSALVSNLPPSGPDGTGELGLVQLARFGAGRLLRRSDRLGQLLRRREQPYDRAEDVAVGDPTQPLSVALRCLVARLDTAEVPRQRRSNYSALLRALSERVPAPFSRLPAGACPFMFPIEVTEKPGALRRLRELRIDAMNFWSLPHPSLGLDDYPTAARWRRTVVGLPVHQGLQPGDIDRLVHAVRQVT